MLLNIMKSIQLNVSCSNQTNNHGSANEILYSDCRFKLLNAPWEFFAALSNPSTSKMKNPN